VNPLITTMRRILRNEQEHDPPPLLLLSICQFVNCFLLFLSVPSSFMEKHNVLIHIKQSLFCPQEALRSHGSTQKSEH